MSPAMRPAARRPAGTRPAAEQLTDVLDLKRDAERRRAVRALLRHPLLTPTRPDPAAFALVRRHAEWLREWFAREAGWSVQVEPTLARLRKVVADLADGTRGAVPAAGQKVQLSRRRYVLVCLALATLERADGQVTLGRLTERVLALAADPALLDAGIRFTLESRDERADLAAVARLLLGLGVLTRVAGDEQAFVNCTGDALYDVDRRVLAALLVTRVGPSTVGAQAFEDRLAAVVAESTPDTEDLRNRAVRHRLARRLLDDPVLYYADLTEDQLAYLAGQRGPMLKRLTEGTGFEAEVRAEGIALLDPSGEATDVGMPEEGTEGHATLLVAELLASGPGSSEPKAMTPTHALAGSVTLSQIEAHVAALAVEHKAYWRKSAAEPGGPRELTGIALGRLESLGLIRRDGERVWPRPALARFAYGAPTVGGRS